MQVNIPHMDGLGNEVCQVCQVHIGDLHDHGAILCGVAASGPDRKLNAALQLRWAAHFFVVTEVDVCGGKGVHHAREVAVLVTGVFAHLPAVQPSRIPLVGGKERYGDLRKEELTRNWKTSECFNTNHPEDV